MENLLYLVIGVAIGALIGVILVVLEAKRKTVDGMLIIDLTDPDKDRYKFCIDDLDSLEEKNTLILSVKKGAVDWED